MLVAAGRLRGKFQPRDQSGLNQVIGNQKIMSRGRAGGWWWCRDWCDTQHWYRCIFWSQLALPPMPCPCSLHLAAVWPHYQWRFCTMALLVRRAWKMKDNHFSAQGDWSQCLLWLSYFSLPNFFSLLLTSFPLCPQTKYAYVLCQIRLCKGGYCFIGEITSSLMNIISSYPLHYPFYEVSSALVSK